MKRFSTLDILSRLKGIETCYLSFRLPFLIHLHFGYTFPFEGNWNKHFMLGLKVFHCSLDILSRLKGIETVKVIRVPTSRVMPRASLETLDILSRLKGIETEYGCSNGVFRPVSLDILSRLKGIETLVTGRVYRTFRELWIYFPVWRELKHVAFNHILGNAILWIYFPVWRELKLKYLIGL